MFFKYSSTPNLKQFAKHVSKYKDVPDLEIKVKGTVKLHGMGVGVNVNRNGDVTFQTHDGPVDHNGETSYTGWRDWSKTIESTFSFLGKLLLSNEENPDSCFVVSAEFFGGKTQTTGSAALAPREGIYIYKMCIKTPNPEYDPSSTKKSNKRFLTRVLGLENTGHWFTDHNIHLSTEFLTVEHVLTNKDIDYRSLELLFNHDVSKIELDCPVGKVINFDGNRIAEGYVYVAEMPELPATEYVGAKPTHTTAFKVKGKLHKRKPGNTLTGVTNAPLNSWVLESEALSNDRLQQFFDKLHKEAGLVTGLAHEFKSLVMADIKKECYVFLDDPDYVNVTDLLITSSLGRPIVNWYKKTLNETFADDLKALEDEHRALKENSKD